MEAYLDLLRELAEKFEKFELIKVSRAENLVADALAALASTPEITVTRIISVETIAQPNIRIEEINFVTRAMRRQLEVQANNPELQQLDDEDEIPEVVPLAADEDSPSLDTSRLGGRLERTNPELYLQRSTSHRQMGGSEVEGHLCSFLLSR